MAFAPSAALKLELGRGVAARWVRTRMSGSSGRSRSDARWGAEVEARLGDGGHGRPPEDEGFLMPRASSRTLRFRLRAAATSAAGPGSGEAGDEEVSPPSIGLEAAVAVLLRSVRGTGAATDRTRLEAQLLPQQLCTRCTTYSMRDRKTRPSTGYARSSVLLSLFRPFLTAVLSQNF